MSISFGSTGIKPYVGSKEVKEAYVGNQLVYKATPPYIYAFLGGENSYTLAPWCSLKPISYATSLTIAKDEGIFRLVYPDGYGYFGIGEIHTRLLSFDARVSTGNNGNLKIYYTTYQYESTLNLIASVRLGTNYQHVTVNIPSNARVILIAKEANTPGVTHYIDAVRFEPV